MGPRCTGFITVGRFISSETVNSKVREVPVQVGGWKRRLSEEIDILYLFL